MTDLDELSEWDPEVLYDIMLACKENGITTEKGNWTIARVKELQDAGTVGAIHTAILEASTLWEGFNPKKKLPIV